MILKLQNHKITWMRSNRVAWSTFMNSKSKVLSSLKLETSTCFLQYSITFSRIFPVTCGIGMHWSAQSTSIMRFKVCHCRATVCDSSNICPSELITFTFFSSAASDDIVAVAVSDCGEFWGEKDTANLRNAIMSVEIFCRKIL